MSEANIVYYRSCKLYWFYDKYPALGLTQQNSRKYNLKKDK